MEISLITNIAAGILNQPLSEEEVIKIGNLKGTYLQKLVTSIIKKIP